jgi:hypothetical protein
MTWLKYDLSLIIDAVNAAKVSMPIAEGGAP